MKTKSKILALVLCAALLVTASIMGTLAYLTAEDTVTNTFTVGDVDILLDEAVVNEYGEPVGTAGNVCDIGDAARVDSNDYKLIPSRKYTKDPTVTVLAGSEESYVRVFVTLNYADKLNSVFNTSAFSTIFAGYDSNVWTVNYRSEDTTANTVTYELRYFETVDTLDNKDLVLEPIFTSFTVLSSADNDDLAALVTYGSDGSTIESQFTIDIVAQAIQVDGFSGDEGTAWTAFATQNTVS